LTGVRRLLLVDQVAGAVEDPVGRDVPDPGPGLVGRVDDPSRQPDIAVLGALAVGVHAEEVVVDGQVGDGVAAVEPPGQ
jgi:hypothetical protein